MATIGRIYPFYDSEEDWFSFVNRLQMFFTVINSPDEKQGADLISLNGEARRTVH